MDCLDTTPFWEISTPYESARKRQREMGKGRLAGCANSIRPRKQNQKTHLGREHGPFALQLRRLQPGSPCKTAQRAICLDHSVAGHARRCSLAVVGIPPQRLAHRTGHVASATANSAAGVLRHQRTRERPICRDAAARDVGAEVQDAFLKVSQRHCRRANIADRTGASVERFGYDLLGCVGGLGDTAAARIRACRAGLAARCCHRT